MNLSKLQNMQRGRLKRLADSVAHLPMFRADLETGVFARRLVTATLAELFRFEYAENKWASGELGPLSSEVDEGANEYGYQEIGYTGRAKIVADNATDIPYVDPEGRDTLHTIKTIACAFRYSTQEVRSAALQGRFDIASEKARGAREAYDTELNDLLRVGAPAFNLPGFTNVPGMLVANAATGNWQAATALQIIADFTAAANLLPNLTSGIEMPNSVVMDVATWTRLSTLQQSVTGDGGNATVLTFLRAAFPMIQNWTWDAGMSTAAQAGGPAVLIYKKDPTRARGVIPMALRALPPEQDGLVFKVTLESRFGGVMAPKPRGALRLDGV